MHAIAESLESMTGSRARCFYCGDSLGGDIDHYYPKSKYPERAFDWDNFLLACTTCNRKKLDEFDFLENKPLLLNPTIDDPWDEFFFEERTGQLVPRCIGDLMLPSPRGDYTLRVIGTLRLEAVIEGRRRTFRNLCRVVNLYLDSTRDCDDCNALKEGLEDNDAYGLLEWFFLKEGSGVPPFSSLQATETFVWSQLVNAISEGAQGLKELSL